MANDGSCVELCADNLDESEKIRLGELEAKNLSLSELLSLGLSRMKRDSVQRQVRKRVKKPFLERV